MILERIDTFWRWLARKADAVMGIGFVMGFLLFGFALYLGLNSVQFDGRFAGGAQLYVPPGATPIVTKQVGFFYAPNWLLTAFLLPLALLYLFRARAAIEPLIVKLVQRRMLVRSDGAPAGEDEVMALWVRNSRWWSGVAALVFLAVVLFTVVADFIPVVLQWNLATPESVSAFITENRISIGHPTYEFDWSVASTFAGSSIQGWVNAAFAFFAYLSIPILGSAILFSAMIWLFSAHAIFNANSLAAEGYKLLPDLGSTDERCGFELFEEFFDNLVRATFITALIVVGMHLQNVYLRAPQYPDIISMVFGDELNVLASRLVAGNFAAILESGLGLRDAWRTLGASAAEFSPQTYVAVVALLMLSVILFAMVWGWLRSTAMRGQDELIEQLSGERYRDQRERVQDMKVWPIGWAGINMVIISVVLVAGSMVWPNFLYLVLAVLLALAVARTVSFVKGAVLDGWRRRRRRRHRPQPAADDVPVPAGPPLSMIQLDSQSEIRRRVRSVGGRQLDEQMLFPSAALLAAHIRTVPRGTARDLSVLRDEMARQHGAQATCPTTSQRLLRQIASDAVTDFAAGRPAVPFWRVVDPDKPSTAKLSGGIAFIRERRAEERG